MTSSWLRAAAALVLLGAVGVGGWAYAAAWAPSPQHYALQGLDLGLEPPSVEWGTVRAHGADFAYLVATDGADRRASGFEANWAALPEAGLRRGAIHLYSLCQLASDQADAFNTFVPRSEDALPTAVDVAFRDGCDARPDRTVLVGELRRFVAMVETHTRKPVLLRIAPAVEARYALSAAIDRPVWAVGNVFPPSYMARPWRLWRASDFRHVEGIDGPINWDVVAP